MVVFSNLCTPFMKVLKQVQTKMEYGSEKIVGETDSLLQDAT